MALAQITDHIQRALDRVVTQFRESGFVKGMLSIFAGETQASEDGLWSMTQAVRSVPTATGTTLDNLGALVGTPVRGLKSDTQYRARVSTQIVANRGSGEFDSVYEVSKLMVGAWNVSGQPKITEYFPGVYEIACDPRASIVNDELEARELAIVLNDSSAAGIRGIVISQQVAAAAAFAFDGGTGLGFGAGDFTGAFDK